MSRSPRIFTLISAAVFALTLASSANAQCFNDDGFNIPGACCIPVNPNLPNFPAINLPAQGCCFENCNPLQVFNEGIALGAPSPVFCDTYTIGITIFGPVAVGPGFLVAKYSRTWEEINATGAIHRQVWRFLVNGDLTYVVPTGAPSPCPYPKIAVAGLPVHFIGSVDYARDCQTGVWSSAINITHLCGAFMHNNYSIVGLTPDPNPNHIYSFVGPAPFAFGPVPAPTGPIIADAMRSVKYDFNVPGLVWVCESEVPIQNGNVTPVTVYCACTGPVPPPPAPSFTDWKINFTYGCNAAGGGQTFDADAFPPLLPTGLTSFALGVYTVPAAIYPSGECVSVYIGTACPTDVCNNNMPHELLAGVGTTGGDIAIVHSTFGAIITTTQFLDLENMLILINGPPYVAIGIGGLFLSTMIWQLNMP